MIILKPVSDDNIWDIVELEVSKDQEDFVATNTESILEAYTTIMDNKVALPFGIYHNSLLIGFVMIGYGRVDEDDPQIADNNYVLWRLMIDKKYQHQGYGRKAVMKIMEYISEHNEYNARYCWLSYEPENKVAQALYRSIGFKENGEICDGELVAVIEL